MAIQDRILGFEPSQEQFDKLDYLTTTGPSNPYAQAIDQLVEAGYERPLLGNLPRMFSNPSDIFHTAVQTGIVAAPALAVGLGVAVAAPVLGATALVTTLAAASAGAATGFGTELLFAIPEAMQHHGLDYNNPKDRDKMDDDPSLFTEVLKTAATYAAGPAAADAMSLGLGSFFAKLATKSTRRVGRNATKYGGQIGLQAASGASGDWAGQKAAYGRVKYDEVLLEALAGGFLGVPAAVVEDYSLRKTQRRKDARERAEAGMRQVYISTLTSEAAGIPEYVDNLTDTIGMYGKTNPVDIVMDIMNETARGDANTHIWVDASEVVRQVEAGNDAIRKASGISLTEISRRAEHGGFVAVGIEKFVTNEALGDAIKEAQNDVKFSINKLTLNEGKEYSEIVRSRTASLREASPAEQRRGQVTDWLASRYELTGLNKADSSLIAEVQVEIMSAINRASGRDPNDIRGLPNFITDDDSFVGKTGDEGSLSEVDAEVERLVSALHLMNIIPEAHKAAAGFSTQDEVIREQARGELDEALARVDGHIGPGLLKDIQDAQLGGLDISRAVLNSENPLTRREVWSAVMTGRIMRASKISAINDTKQERKSWLNTGGDAVQDVVNYLDAAPTEEERGIRLNELLDFYGFKGARTEDVADDGISVVGGIFIPSDEIVTGLSVTRSVAVNRMNEALNDLGINRAQGKLTINEKLNIRLEKFGVPASRVDEVMDRVKGDLARLNLTESDYTDDPKLITKLEKALKEAGLVPEQSRNIVEEVLAEPTKSQRVMGIFASGNQRTAMHEFGHLAFEELKDSSIAGVLDPALQKDLEKLVGMKIVDYISASRSEKVVAHERFANALTDYIARGAVPNKRLQGLFRRLARSLARIYGYFVASGAQMNLSKDAEVFFDRLLAADIATKEDAAANPPAYEDAVDAEAGGLTPEQHEVYQDAIENRDEIQFERGLHGATTTPQDVDELSALASEIETDQAGQGTLIDEWKNPTTVVQAFNREEWAVVSPGVQYDENGDYLEHPEGVLNHPYNQARADEAYLNLVDNFGGEAVSRVQMFWRGKPNGHAYLVAGTIPEEILSRSGYESAFTKKGWIGSDGAELSTSNGDPSFWSGAKDAEHFFQLEGGIRFSVPQEYKDTGGPIVLRSTIPVSAGTNLLPLSDPPSPDPDTAPAGLISRILREEVKPKRKTVSERLREPNTANALSRAQRVVGNMRVGAVLAGTDQQKASTEKLARQAKTARDAGDITRSNSLKKAQLNETAVRQEMEAQAMILNRRRSDYHRYSRPWSPEVKVSKDWYDGIRQVLDWYGLVSSSRNYKVHPDVFLKDKIAAGHFIQNRLIDLRSDSPVDWENLPVIDAENLDVLIKQMEFKGLTDQDVETGPLAPEINTMRENVTAVERKDKDELSKTHAMFRGGTDKAIAFQRGFENIFIALDGGKERLFGPWWTNMFKPLSDAQDQEIVIGKEYGEAVIEAFQKAGVNKKRPGWLTDKIDVGGAKLTREEIFVLVLNSGTVNGQRTLLNGSLNKKGINLDVIEAARKILNDQEWEGILKLWDLNESLHSEIDEVDLRVFGAKRHRSKPLGFFRTNDAGKDVFIEGKWFKPTYELEPGRWERQELSQLANRAAGVVMPEPNDSPNNRGRKVDISITGVLNAFTKGVHHLTHLEPVGKVATLLSSPNLQKTIEDATSEDHLIYMKQWLVSVAATSLTPADVMNDWIRVLRVNAATAIMAFNIRSAAQQIFGLTSSITQQRETKHIYDGMSMMMHDYSGAMKRMKEASPYMNSRQDTAHRELKDGAPIITDTTMSRYRKVAWVFTRVSDMHVSATVWWGVYIREERNGLSHEERVAYADRAVRQSQGSARTVDRPVMLLGGESRRFWTMFISPLNAVLNIQMNLGREALITDKSAKSKMWFALSFLLNPATWAIGGYAVFNAPSEGETEEEHMFYSLLAAMLDSYPIVRDLGRVVEGRTRGIEPTPLSGLAQSATAGTNFFKGLSSNNPGDFGRAVKALYTIVGYMTGLPVVVPNRISKAVDGYSEGKYNAVQGTLESLGIRGIGRFIE